MKGFVVLLLCLFCLSGCGYSLEGTWKFNSTNAATERMPALSAGDLIKLLSTPPVAVEVEFRSDGSITSEVGKVEGLTWHGDYICLKVDTKKIRDARTEQLTNARQDLVLRLADNKARWLNEAKKWKEEAETFAEHATFPSVEAKKDYLLADAEKQKQYVVHFAKPADEKLEKELKAIDQQLEDLKNGKVMEWDAYFPHGTMEKGVDKKDISESADKVEVRIHWVDADHFDLGSTSFSRVKLPK